MLNKFKELYKIAFEAHNELSQALYNVEAGLDSESAEDVADANLVLDEITKLMEDLRKQAFAKTVLTNKLLCLRWLQIADGEPIRTKVCSYSPRVIHMPKIPSHKKEPEAYAAVCRYFGLSDETIENRTFQPHWPSLLKRVEELAEEGKPLPAGLDKQPTYPEYRVTRTKKKGETILGD